MKTWLVATLVAVALMTLPTITRAQDWYGERIKSMDGQWMAPVASRLLGSTDDHHVRRGSINSWDWSVSAGTPVFAAREGVVGVAGEYLYERGFHYRMQGYGVAVEIQHPDGIVSQYGHCAEGSLLVKKGDQVDQNTQLCVAGLTGVTSFYHIHFTILVNGSPIRIDSVFDINQMKICHLCSGDNDPNAPIRNAVAAFQREAEALGNAQTPRHENQSTPAWQLMLERVKTAPPNLLGGVALALLFFLFILKDRWRNLVLSVAVCGLVMVAMSDIPVANLKTAQAQAEQSSVPTGETWDVAYAFMRGWEGGPNPRCVHDPGRTWKGVTQTTYNAYRASKGLPQQDVCGLMTEDEAKEIYYERYWLASGAAEIAKTNPQLAIAHFDFAVNAGAGKGGAPDRILQQSGGDPSLYNQLRESWYQTRKSCSLYCRGWLRRVADIRKITER